MAEGYSVFSRPSRIVVRIFWCDFVRQVRPITGPHHGDCVHPVPSRKTLPHTSILYYITVALVDRIQSKNAIERLHHVLSAPKTDRNGPIRYDQSESSAGRLYISSCTVTQTPLPM